MILIGSIRQIGAPWRGMGAREAVVRTSAHWGARRNPQPKHQPPKNSPGHSGYCPWQQDGPRPLLAKQGAVCCGPHADSTGADTSEGASRLGYARSLSRTLDVNRRLL